MARGTWADAVRVREGRRALERRRGDPFVRTKHNSVSASLYTRYSQRDAKNPVSGALADTMYASRELG